jgi:ADP-ribose pyrophosphatase
MTSRKVDILERVTAFQGYFRVDRYRLRHETFDGGMSAEITREIFERGHAAAALPYDPVRDESSSNSSASAPMPRAASRG